MNIGVFDSGVGGRSVANAVERAFPEHNVVFVCDSEHMPYGNKQPDELLHLVLPILHELAERCAVIVIACNTLTTTLIDRLRQEIAVPLVGIEPMIKPASQRTKTAVIAVCATPTTLASQRYNALKASYAGSITVLEPDCSQWASMIEANAMRHHHVQAEIDNVCSAGADVIVLGCTHFHWIEDVIKQAASGRAIVMQPEQATVRQLWLVLARL